MLLRTMPPSEPDMVCRNLRQLRVQYVNNLGEGDPPKRTVKKAVLHSFENMWKDSCEKDGTWLAFKNASEPADPGHAERGLNPGILLAFEAVIVPSADMGPCGLGPAITGVMSAGN